MIEGCEGGDADVVFVVDESGSINNANFEKVTAFVADVIEMLDIETGRVRHLVLFNITHGFRKEQ